MQVGQAEAEVERGQKCIYADSFVSNKVSIRCGVFCVDYFTLSR